MVRRHTLRDAIGDISTRGMIAYRSGWEAWTPDVDPGEVRAAIVKAGGVHLSEDEQMAYGAMMPATWWQNWFRGWDAARRGLPCIGGDQRG